jgi:Ca-activated chloride channel family protein
MTFAYPWVLAGLLVIPLLIWRYRRQTPAGRVGFSTAELLAAGAQKSWKHHSFFILRLLALAALIVATARPQSGQTKVKRSSEGLDIVLAVDTSGSMKAMDFEIDGQQRNRLFVVKQVIEEFVRKRLHDRIGLVVFGTEAFTQAPLTLDHDVLTRFLQSVKIGMAGENTAIGNAIATAVKRLKDIEAKNKIIILLTDGENTAGSIEPLQATEAAKTLGVRIYTVGVGSHDPVPFPVQTWFRTVYEKRRLKLDEELLTKIAETTGGRYFLASDTQELQKIYNTIDQLEKTEIEVQEFRNMDELGHWFLAGGLVLLMGEFLLGLTSWRRIP